MSAITPRHATLELLDRIIDRSRAAVRDVPDDVILAVLRELETLGDIAVLLDLFLLVGGGDKAITSARAPLRKLFGLVSKTSTALSPVEKAALETASRLVLAACPRDLVQLDRFIQESRLRWTLLFPLLKARVLWDAAERTTSIGLLAIACSNPDGHVREEALCKIESCHDGSELPFLLLRLDDWVAPVQMIAIRAVQSRLVPAFAARFIECFPIIASLNLRQRARATKLVEWVRTLLLQPELAGELLKGLGSPDRHVRRHVLELCTESQHLAPRTVMEIAIQDPDFAVRLRATRLGKSRLAGEDARWLTQKLLSDPHPHLRADGLERFVGEEGAAARETLIPALLHRAEVVRYTARYHLGKLGFTQFASHYRDALASDRLAVLRAALAGLAQTGDAQDVERVRSFLHHPASSVARAALLAVAQLDKEAAREAALDLLQEGRPGVSKTARVVLHLQIRDSDRAALWRAISEGQSPQARERALGLAFECSTWVALPILLRAAALEQEEVRETASCCIREWLRSYRHSLYAPKPPTADELRECREAFSEASSVIDPENEGALREILG